MNELCVDLGIEVIEKNIEPYDVYTADEAFMTGYTILYAACNIFEWFKHW